METRKKAKPTGACSACQAAYDRHEALNQRCDRVVNGRRCAGIVRSAVNALWDECESCHASGKLGLHACRDCGGFGWKLYA